MTKKISLILSKSNLKNYSWKSKYYWINKENLALNIFEEINIQKYITRIFQIYGLLIHSCKINISKFKLEIFEEMFESGDAAEKIVTLKDAVTFLSANSN